MALFVQIFILFYFVFFFVSFSWLSWKKCYLPSWLHRQMLTDVWFICIYSVPLHGWLHACAGLWVSQIGSGSKNDLLCKWQLKRLKQWVNVWCVCKRVCVCWSWNCFCWGRKNKTGSYQETTRTGPISSHCWAINVKLIAFHSRKEKQGADCLRFHFL